MRYRYYPGCSLEGTAREYNLSTRALMGALGGDFREIDDWTCCGASAADATSHLLSLALPARNLALAAKQGEGDDILVPCSACYLNLKKVEEKTRRDPELRAQLNEILIADQLQLDGRARVRHLLDVLARDMGADRIRPLVRRPFTDFSIAPYYGCQCLRPYAVFDDPEAPQSMEPLIKAIGARIHPWCMGGQCCGAAHMQTQTEVGMELVTAILQGAKGADAIVTVCPMCQMNLEAYQHRIGRKCAEDLRISVLYLPQLLGLAMGLPQAELGLDLNLAITPEFRKKLSA
ncbi:MAG: CoB--CoM heterodisulfide reductase iron-sulfur subunit B family protein [Desulfobacterales bacterium]|nr:MAG: CoB--CoM heterodisulfide reductase iron-sulfur subunit B family protein [Desulfobacterales bacterium]